MDEPTNKPAAGPGYETRDFNLRRIVPVGFVAIILLIVALFVLNQIFVISKEKMSENMALVPISGPLGELRSHEDEVLNSYKVLDPQKGIYQIPINRAMEILANQALKNGQSQGNRKAP